MSTSLRALLTRNFLSGSLPLGHHLAIGSPSCHGQVEPACYTSQKVTLSPLVIRKTILGARRMTAVLPRKLRSPLLDIHPMPRFQLRTLQTTFLTHCPHPEDRPHLCLSRLSTRQAGCPNEPGPGLLGPAGTPHPPGRQLLGLALRWLPRSLV